MEATMYRLHNIVVSSKRDFVCRGIVIRDFSVEPELTKLAADTLIEYEDDDKSLIRCTLNEFIPICRDNAFVGESKDKRGYYVCKYSDIAASASEYIWFSRFLKVKKNEIHHDFPDERYRKLLTSEFTLDRKYRENLELGKSFYMSAFRYGAVVNKNSAYYLCGDFANIDDGNIVDYILNNKDCVQWQVDKKEIWVLRALSESRKYSNSAQEFVVAIYEYSEKFLKYLIM